MFYADAVGVDRVYAKICEFHDKLGAWWKPAPLLEKLAKEVASSPISDDPEPAGSPAGPYRI